MILGSTLKRHTHRVSTRPGSGEGCALQLAGVLDEDGNWVSPEVLIDFAYHPDVVCPVCQERGSFFNTIAWHLNDTHRWSIDAIAEWVDQFEPATPAPKTITAEVEEVYAYA